MPSLARAYVASKRTPLRRLTAGPMLPSPSARDLPRTVWLFWAQGEDAAPEVVRLCLNSWRERNPGWTVTFLDRASAREAVDLSDIPDDLEIQAFSDILRTRLLRRRGGVWADATLYCSTPLSHWLDMLMAAGFFVFSRPHPNRMIASWFVASVPEGAVVSSLDRTVTRHWAELRSIKVYFWYHYLFEYKMRAESTFRRRLAAMPRIDARASHRLQVYVTAPPERRGPPPDLEGVPVHKLSWKKDVDLPALRALMSAERSYGRGVPGRPPAAPW